MGCLALVIVDVLLREGGGWRLALLGFELLELESGAGKNTSVEEVLMCTRSVQDGRTKAMMG